MQIVLNSFGASLGKTGARFVVRRRDESPLEVAAGAVSGIVLAGRGMSLSADAVALAAEHRMGITFTTPSGEPYARTAFEGDLAQATLRREQYRAMEDSRGTFFASVCVQSKIRNQAATLRYYAKTRRVVDPELHDRLRQAADRAAGALPELGRIADGGADPDTARAALTALEAAAAKQYWGGVARMMPADLGFHGRERRGAGDPLNVCLNYAYGILRTRVWTACVNAGLDPYAGFLHTLEDGKLALVFDLMEPFRACAADRPVFAALLRGWRPTFQEGLLERESRERITACVFGRLEDRVPLNGKKVKLADLITEKARELARFLRRGVTPKPWTAPW